MKLDKLGNEFHITTKKRFEQNRINEEIILKSFEFAYEMVFGDGHHRNHRTGGQEERIPIKIFRNTLQGKIAEGALHAYFSEQKIICEEVDYSIHGEGVWDDTDLVYKGVKISIKSAAFFSNLLLLETKDWDSDGRYIPNINKTESHEIYDYFILVRIKPNTNSIFNGSIHKESLKSEVVSIDWYYDIAGCCSLRTLIYIIENEYILPQNSLLNGKIKMDAENYYIQSGELKDITELTKILKKL